MSLVVDTSVIIAVITNELHKQKCIELTQNEELIAPSSLHWEIGNAFTAMFKRKRMGINQVRKALIFYAEIPIKFYHADLKASLEIAEKFHIYAYDAYFLECALHFNIPLISLDKNLIIKAKEAGITIKGVIL